MDCPRDGPPTYPARPCREIRKEPLKRLLVLGGQISRRFLVGVRHDPERVESLVQIVVREERIGERLYLDLLDTMAEWRDRHHKGEGDRTGSARWARDHFPRARRRIAP